MEDEEDSGKKGKRGKGRPSKVKRGPQRTDTLNPKLPSSAWQRETHRQYNRNKREKKKRRESGEDDKVEHCDEGELTEEEAGEGTIIIIISLQAEVFSF